jgi:hypothetical protein
MDQQLAFTKHCRRPLYALPKALKDLIWTTWICYHQHPLVCEITQNRRHHLDPLRPRTQSQGDRLDDSSSCLPFSVCSQGTSQLNRQFLCTSTDSASIGRGSRYDTTSYPNCRYCLAAGHSLTSWPRPLRYTCVSAQTLFTFSNH